MAKLNRDNFNDAKEAIEKLIPNSIARKKLINFLVDAVSYADAIKSDNWNLNLDLSGHFLRFNTGHEYCIQLVKERLLILCDRRTIKPIIEKENIPVLFQGFNKEAGLIVDTDIDKVPDLLVKTKNSVGCVIEHGDIEGYIDFFNQSNKDFIRAAMDSHLMPNMRQAHSKGAVDYIFSQFDTNQEFPIPDFLEFIKAEETKLNKAKSLTQKERLEILAHSNKKPGQTTVTQNVFIRNQYVVAEVLYRANGHCESCKSPAPFLRNTDNTPYLEVHHILTLAEGGDDTVENAIALCPNCHRKAHYGIPNAI
jgi:hypothetical protein